MADNWQLKAVLSAVDNMSPVLKNIGNVAKTARKYLSDVGGAAGNLSGKIGMPMAAISGILSGFSLVAVKNAVVGFTDMGEAVQKGALKAGMSVEQYQRMKYVAEQSGTSIEAMEGSLSKLNRSMGDAAIGKNEKLASLMSHLGLSLRDSNGQLRTGVDLLPQLADAFTRSYKRAWAWPCSAKATPKSCRCWQKGQQASMTTWRASTKSKASWAKTTSKVPKIWATLLKTSKW